MSEIKSIEKLRELRDEAASKMVDNPRWVCARAEKIADEIEAEIAEKYMLLPVDADGVPIHVGDSIEYPNGRRDIVRFITVNDNAPTFNESGWIASKCRHVKQRTVEDVLEELLDEPDWEQSPDSYGDIKRRIIAKYAAELQMRGDAE